MHFGQFQKCHAELLTEIAWAASQVKIIRAADADGSGSFLGQPYRLVAGPKWLQRTTDDGLPITQSGATSYICTMHPTAQIKGAGQKIAYWKNIGKRLAGAE